MSVEEKNVIYFELLGSFAIGTAENGEVKEYVIPEKAGKKVLSFLQYLVINHKRSISLEELIEQFWPEEDSIDPGNALKNMMFRTRNYLKAVFPERKGLLRKLPGCYIWNHEIRIETDTEWFEQRYLNARRKEGEERTRLFLEVISLYKGDFLTGNESDWAAPIWQYYQTLYLDACREVLLPLQEEKRWTEVVRICKRAYEIDLSMDIFVVYHMQALLALGQPEKAVQKYQMYRRMLLQEYELAPGEQVEQAYELAADMCRKGTDMQRIMKLIPKKREQRSVPGLKKWGVEYYRELLA